jgi:hypothetical protein
MLQKKVHSYKYWSYMRGRLYFNKMFMFWKKEMFMCIYGDVHIPKEVFMCKIFLKYWSEFHFLPPSYLTVLKLHLDYPFRKF